ncbi:hypothetical protein [Virgibacillus senegalensis]|uniref:hypothetical protein n=1 Tax=Virgibacillus senegalensis TaxID=1499679 RepID=UPI00069F20BF|nr:hypothetical protein [Virgibacillus senegalensis]
MSFRQMITKYFGNHAETSESHWDPDLQTHYFKTTKEKGLQAVEDFFKRSDSCEVVAQSKEHGEISVNYTGGRKAFIIATVIMVKPYRTAIDFSVTTESIMPFDFGFSHNLIPKLYSQLKKELTFLETSMTKNADIYN